MQSSVIESNPSLATIWIESEILLMKFDLSNYVIARFKYLPSINLNTNQYIPIAVMRGKESKFAKEFIEDIKRQNQGTAEAYETRLGLFNLFLNQKKEVLLDDVVTQLQQPKSDPYSLLSEFVGYMAQAGMSARYQGHVIKTVRLFLEVKDVEISKTKFRMKVRMQKPVVEKKVPITKEDIRNIVSACDNPRLKTYVMFLAATGMRAREATHIRIRDLHLDHPDQPYVKVRAETTKTKNGRNVYLTQEIVHQLQDYLNWKYRERRTQYDHEADKVTYGKFIPEKDNNDYVFMPYHHKGEKTPQLRSIYVDLDYNFSRLLERIGMGQKEENNPKRHEITFHSFRRFVRTEISKLGFTDYAEGYIGHASSTYWTAPEEDNIAIFRKIEPYLTYMDFTELEAKAQDTNTQLEDKEERIRHLEKEVEKRNRKIDELYETMEKYEDDWEKMSDQSALATAKNTDSSLQVIKLMAKALKAAGVDDKQLADVMTNIANIEKSKEEYDRVVKDKLALSSKHRRLRGTDQI